MVDLSKYGEILDLTNISVILSIAIISIMLYKISKDTSLLITFCIYSSELILYYVLGSYSYNQIISASTIYIVCIFYLLKLMALIVIRTKFELSIKVNIFLLIINLSNLVIVEYSGEIYTLVIALTNLIILKQFILVPISKFGLDFQENKNILQGNKEYIEHWDNKILYEYDMQNKYKDEIVNLNYKISKSIEEADVPIFLLNINKEYVYSNQSFENLIKEDKQIEDNGFDILSYIQNKFIDGKEIIDTIQNIGNKKYENITVKSKDKKIYRFICTTDTIEDQSVIIGILTDITRSTVIQNKLKDSEERYKNLMDILNEGIIIHDEHCIDYINSKALDIFNLKHLESQIKVSDLKESISRKYIHKFLMNLDNVKNGIEDKISNKLETKDGKVIEFITTVLSFNDKSMFISIIIDITELERALEDIEESEKTYKLLLHTLPEGIMIIDVKSKKHSYLNESMIDILKKVGVENINDLIKKYISECEYGKFKKMTLNSKDILDLGIAIIENKEEGNLVVIARVLNSEHKMQKIKEELRNISQKNKFKTEFLYNIINDIKEPINTIYSINNIVVKNKEKYKSSYIENYTRLLKQNCYRLIRLSNNIEEVNKIENGKYNLELRKCDIVKLTKHITQVAQFYAEEKEITMKFNSNYNKKIVIVDVNKIEKIILNILSNAIKFTDPGGRIDVNIKVEENIDISIKDTGIGIAQDDIETIFESFEQVDRTLSRGAEGTGIGLYLVKKLSEIHNIKIDVHSELGKGSEFKVVIRENEKIAGLQIDNRIYSNLSDTEKIDIEFSDIYFDISS